jgi:tRNA(Arg) A34 adenosine deaminase TadA
MNVFFEQAAEIARLTGKTDTRSYLLGCVGVRADGAIISSRNGSVDQSPSTVFSVIPQSHAETRAVRKMDGGSGSSLFVVRLRRADEAFALAKPCPTCQVFIRGKSIQRVYYSIDNERYGLCENGNFDSERVFTF